MDYLEKVKKDYQLLSLHDVADLIPDPNIDHNTVKSLYKRHNINPARIKKGMFITVVQLDNLLEKTKCYGSSKEETTTISKAPLRIITKEKSLDNLHGVIDEVKQKR